MADGRGPVVGKTKSLQSLHGSLPNIVTHHKLQTFVHKCYIYAKIKKAWWPSNIIWQNCPWQPYCSPSQRWIQWNLKAYSYIQQEVSPSPLCCIKYPNQHDIDHLVERVCAKYLFKWIGRQTVHQYLSQAGLQRAWSIHCHEHFIN